MHCELLFPSKFLKAWDLRGEQITLTIAEVKKNEELVMVGGQKDVKPSLYFEEIRRKAKDPDDEKRLVLNKTNMRIVKLLHGKNTKDWIGKKITLYPTETLFGGEYVEAIRVRIPDGQKIPKMIRAIIDRDK